MTSLQAHALAVCTPSLTEGFGLPPVEAMACGTPVAASRVGSLPEVIGDAGLFFEPTDHDGMGATIRRMFDDYELRGRLAAQALQRVRRFRRSATAQALLDCFEELAPPPSAPIPTPPPPVVSTAAPAFPTTTKATSPPPPPSDRRSPSQPKPKPRDRRKRPGA